MNMHGSIKIQTTHLNRQGIVYIRQSDPKQVREHKESAIYQRALCERLLELGWKANQIIMVDGDQGISAKQAAGRESFQKLVADVGLGKIGIIVGYEVSRLARNCADWHRLLELCALSDTLIGDSDGVYSSRDFNDRLLLGLKGTMSEAELHSLRLRLNAGRMSKAKRGELVHHLPTGFVRTESGEVTFDPDESVKCRIELVFSKFQELGSGLKVLRYFAQQKLTLPRRQTSGLHAGEVLWKPVTLSAIHSILKNPAYAGAFAYGRRQAMPIKQIPGRPASGRLRRDRKDWLALVKDVYPAFIGWQDWEKIQAKMQENYQMMQSRLARSQESRQGHALLTGLVRCGKCGHAMAVHYKNNRFQYKCCKSKYELGQGPCQFVSGERIDESVVAAFFEAIRPAHIDALESASRQQASELAQRLKLHRQEVDRLNYAAHRAERQYDKVDPENRLIAATLERKWEQAVEDLESARRNLTEAEHGTIPLLKISDADRKLFSNVGHELPKLWPKLTDASRKALLRTLIKGVNLDRADDGRARIRIVWRGGSVTEFERQVPIHSRRYTDLEKQVVERVRMLTEEGLDCEAITAKLNAEGYIPCRGGQFTRGILMKLKQRYGIVSKIEQARRGNVPKNKYTAQEIAIQISVDCAWIYRKIQLGAIRIEKDRSYGCYLFPRTKLAVQQLRQLKQGSRAHVTFP
jgi:DNA invertase Pin-like site-specific DNA recombinase